MCVISGCNRHLPVETLKQVVGKGRFMTRSFESSPETQVQHNCPTPNRLPYQPEAPSQKSLQKAKARLKAGILLHPGSAHARTAGRQ